MQQKIRILQVVTRMGRGGAETMIMNYYRCLDRSKYQFDFFVHRKERADYDDEIESMGGRIFRAFPIYPQNYFSYFSFLDAFFKKHHTDFVAVHCHIQENSGFALKYAAKYGIKNRLCTSHCAGKSFDFKYPFRLFASFFLQKYVTKRLSCGIDAGKALYGKEKFLIFPNAINVDDFIFNECIRKKLRKDLCLNDSLVIGNVARLSPEKNHLFMIDVFEELLKLQSNAKLIFVGSGQMYSAIQKKIKERCLEDKIMMLGVRNNVNQILQAFDILLFPSLFEGLPMSVIEAQTAGLKCVLSDSIDKDVMITDNVYFLSLKREPKYWAQMILEKSNYMRENMAGQIKSTGYDVKSNIEKLLSLYLQ